MTAKLRPSIRPSIFGLIAIAAGALMSSCAYDPYHSSVSSSVGYSSHGGVSSSVLIRTSNSRWGYDPHCRSYYDYTRQCYYDPWLRGYYPRGYRPPVIVGVPHPHGWRPGRRVCPPPVRVHTRTISNHRNRYHHYKKLNHSWCQNLRVASTSNPRIRPSNHSNRSSNNRHSSNRNDWNRSNRKGLNHGTHSNNSHSNRSSSHRTRGLPSNHSNVNRQNPLTRGNSASRNRNQILPSSRSNTVRPNNSSNWNRSSSSNRGRTTSSSRSGINRPSPSSSRSPSSSSNRSRAIPSGRSKPSAEQSKPRGNVSRVSVSDSQGRGRMKRN